MGDRIGILAACLTCLTVPAANELALDESLEIRKCGVGGIILNCSEVGNNKSCVKILLVVLTRPTVIDEVNSSDTVCNVGSECAVIKIKLNGVVSNSGGGELSVCNGVEILTV